MKTDNFIFKNLEVIIIVILMGLLFLQRSCQPDGVDMNDYIKIGGKEYKLLSVKQDTAWLPSKRDTFYLPSEKEYINVPVPQDVDTAAVLKDYFAKRVYSDTHFINDDERYGTVTIKDTISQNSIFSRYLLFDVNIPEITNTIVVQEKPRRHLYAGIGMNFDKINILNSVYGGFLYKTRKDQIYGLNLGLSSNRFQEITPYIGASMYWKIRLRKEKPRYTTLEKQAAQLIINGLD